MAINVITIVNGNITFIGSSWQWTTWLIIVKVIILATRIISVTILMITLTFVFIKTSSSWLHLCHWCPCCISRVYKTTGFDQQPTMLTQQLPRARTEASAGHCCVSNTWNAKQWSTTYTLMLYSTHQDSKTGHGLVCYCFTNMKRHFCWFVWPGVWRLHTDVLLCWFSPLRHSHHTILLFCPKAVKMLFCTTKLFFLT